MTEIYLVRHAHSTYTPKELTRPLSEKGYADAMNLISLFKNIHVDVMISSPYKRAVETLQGIADDKQLSITLDERFKERQVADKPLEDFKVGMKMLWSNPDFNYEGGQSNNEAKIVGVKGLEAYLNIYQNKSVLIGTHGNIMTLIMGSYDSKYNDEFWQTLEMPAVYKMTFNNTRYIESEIIT